MKVSCERDHAANARWGVLERSQKHFEHYSKTPCHARSRVTRGPENVWPIESRPDMFRDLRTPRSNMMVL